MTHVADRVRLVYTTDEHTKLKPGDEGVVKSIDGFGTLHIAWDSGSSLGLVPGEDRWKVIVDKGVNVRFPYVEVKLSDEDGNAFFIISRVRHALQRGGATSAEIADFSADATSGDYDHVLQTVMRWVRTT